MNGKIKILIADDDADDRALFRSAYEDRSDIELMPLVMNGEEVISKLNNIENADQLPDLVILDHNMPLMNGRQCLAAIKSNQRFSNIRVSICSTYADAKLINDCIKLGAYKVSSKPVTQDEYQDMLNDFILEFSKV